MTEGNEPSAREQDLAWELIEEISRCDEGHLEGVMVRVIADAFARYRGELKQIHEESFQCDTQKIEQLERQLAILMLRA